MGALPQHNEWTPQWTDFFIQQRLVPLVEQAQQRGLLQSAHINRFETLYRRLPELFPPVAPALLHGDLWSGNFLCDAGGQPVLIDPAVYYGHPAMDLAMTTLFGGFDPSFYDAYFYHAPQPAHYRRQWDACNLYPLLVHLNLFGSGYLGEIEGILRQFQ
jgi:fructosamine-3-kinase